MDQLFDRNVAILAVDLVRPAIEAAMKAGLLKRQILVIDVADPTTGEKMYSFVVCLKNNEGQQRFEVLARKKCELAHQTGMDTAKVVGKCPHLLAENDVKYPGGVNRDGIIVGCSGVEAYYDQMFAGMVAEAIKAICISIVQNEILPSDSDLVRLGGR